MATYNAYLLLHSYIQCLGTLQGSPLSPVLFILFITTLYKKLDNVQGLVTVGFADNTNLLAVPKKAEDTTKILEKSYRICDQWAKERGMKFEPAKSELIHFSRKRHPRTDGVAILNNGGVLQPVKLTRFLEVWLDRKLTFASHKKTIATKIKTQTLVLTRLTGKT